MADKKKKKTESHVDGHKVKKSKKIILVIL